MNRQGRILIVDDLERWREIISHTLRCSGFHVDTAATTGQAWERLAKTFYHLLVLDISMDDTDQTNVEGMELLQTLDENFGPAVAIIMLSAHGTKEQMREAFRDYSVIDFLAKEDFDNLEFREQVQRFFSHQIRINFDLDIHWQNVSGPKKVVLGVKVNQSRIKNSTPLQTRIADELDDLLCRLFYEADSLLLRPLVPGYSGAGVLWVQPFYATGGGGRAEVVKFGDIHKIDKEYRHFKKYVEPFVGGGRRTAVRELRRTPKLGGISYSLVGSADDRLEDFGSFYRRANLVQVKKVLDHLFRDTCAGWYANPGKLQPYDLTGNYQKSLKFTPAELEQTLSESLSSVQGKNKLRFSSLNRDRAFKNPIPATANQRLMRPTYVCITHGDLNERNILIDQAGQTWLIDFQHTGPGHILRDVAQLDSVVRFQLLTAKEATLAERLKMEETLCRLERFSQLEQLAIDFATENQALTKSFATAVHLRMLAHKLIAQNPSDDFSEYHIASLYQALKTLQFISLPDLQREHALLSASLLVDCLGL